ncbi:MAG: HepT-like ribonuclease domain-containing protein [Pseudomonadota bacterium]
MRNLQTLSEATQRLPDSKKSYYPDIPWHQISGFRNILVHDYLGNIDSLAVTGVIDQHLEPLGQAVREMLASDNASR